MISSSRAKIHMRQVKQLVGSFGFEHLLLLLYAEVENRSQEVGQAHRFNRAQDRHSHFGRDAGQQRQSLLNHCLHIAFGSFHLFRIDDPRFRQDFNDRTQVRILLLPFEHLYPLSTLRDDVHRFVKPFHPLDHHEGADVVQFVGCRVSSGGALRPNSDTGNQLLRSCECGFDRCNRTRSAHGQRNYCFGK